MKKILALLLIVPMIFALAVPSFAAKTVKFSVRTVSETDSEIVISVDYESGTPFNCFDIEVTYNEKKLKVLEAYDGDGLDAFVRYAKKNEGAVSASTVNKDTNPIKDSMAITSAFKVIDGKDLFVAKFKKLSKDKITANDIKVVFTNCATETEKIQASVVNTIGGGSTDGKVTSAAAKPTADNKTEKTVSAEKTSAEDNKETTSVNDNKQESTSSELTSEQSETVTDVSADNKSETAEEISDSVTEITAEKQNNTKKIIIISASAICLLFVIVAVCIFVSKKAKKEQQ